MASSSNIWWQILAGNPHDCSWSHFPDYPSSSEPCIPCQPCSCPPCPTESFWVRPEEWPVLPEFSSDVDQRIVGLVAVEDTDLEAIAILCEGDYQVDWGDGTVDLVAGGVKAEHRYTYADITTAALSYGYKTVIVVVTPQEGSSLTTVDFSARFTDYPFYYLADGSTTANISPVAKWLDLDLQTPFCTSLKFYEYNGAEKPFLEQVTIREHSATDLSWLFSECPALMSVPLFDTSAVTDMNSMFIYCTLLESVPSFDTSNVTDMSGMFEGCMSLLCVPLLDTSQVTDTSGMFGMCFSLPCVPLFDTAAVVYADSMFSSCYSLSCVPSFDMGSVEYMNATFWDCPSITALPSLNTISAWALDSAFGSTRALKYAHDLAFPQAFSVNSMFAESQSLTRLPSVNCADAVSRSYLNDWCQACHSLNESFFYGARYGDSTEGYVSLPMSAEALNKVFTNLGTAAGTQYLKITGCYGAADPACDRSIATSKGWTIIG